MKTYTSSVIGYEGECAADEYFVHGNVVCGWFRIVKKFWFFKYKTGSQFYGQILIDIILTK